MYKYHPEIEGLKCNEDGTKIYLNGNLLKIHSNAKEWKYIIIGKTIGISRIVCECWNGIPPNSSYVVKRKDNEKNNTHYTNLFWGISGNNPLLTEQDIKQIKHRLKAGEKQSAIAKDYNVSRNTIYTINKKLK